jgi:hypothetical protein
MSGCFLPNHVNFNEYLVDVKHDVISCELVLMCWLLLSVRMRWSPVVFWQCLCYYPSVHRTHPCNSVAVMEQMPACESGSPGVARQMAMHPFFSIPYLRVPNYSNQCVNE